MRTPAGAVPATRVPQRGAGSFEALVLVAGAAVLLLVLGRSGGDFTTAQGLGVCMVLALLTAVSELRPIVLARGDRQGSVTVSPAFALALVFVGPLWLAMLAMCGAIACQRVRGYRGWRSLSVDGAQTAVSLLAARWVYATATGQSLLHGEPMSVPADLHAALAAGAALFLVSNTLSGIAVALEADGSVLEQLRSDLQFQLATSGVLLSFAPVLATAAALTLWLVPMMLLPIGAIHRSAQLGADREHEALHDGLTGLPNRALFRLRVTRACAETSAGGSGFAVLLLDLDHFKEINDTLGHHVGDDLLQCVSDRLARHLRPQDTVARLGGDEFVVLVHGLAAEAEALHVADRLLDALEEPFVVEGVRLEVGASVGIALHPAHGDDVDQLLQRADIALYGAKVDRGGHRMYDVSDDVHTPERLTVAAELREGIERGELFLQHQPKVELATGRVVGFEALVRWRHPRRGVVMPDDFLPVVENTGLITPLTLTVLDLALAAVASWRAHGHDVTVAVNLSVRHLTDLGLPAQVDAALRAHGLPPEALVLEVTETLIMSDPTRAADVLRLLHDLGVGVAVDDFGTGYSSLAYLRRLEIDELKIDKSFVQTVTQEDGDAVIVRSTVEMGRNLGLRLVAEGVEDEATRALLLEWGCHVAQGYLFSRPLDDDSVLEWLTSRRAAVHLAGLPAARQGH